VLQKNLSGETIYNVLAFLDFSHTADANNHAYSPSGDQVQNEILSELNRCKDDETNVICISHDPFPSWPSGPIYVKSKKSKTTYFPNYFNIPILKQFIYCVNHIYFMAKLKPRVVIKYNIGLLDAYSMYLMRMLFGIKITVIIQDIVLPEGGGVKNLIKRMMNIKAVAFAKNFDLIIPISDKIAMDFDYLPSKVMVFRGAVTRQTNEIIEAISKSDDEVLLDRAIFAGALEPYNGVDFLINSWIKEEISVPIIIFGDGSLKKLVIEAQQQSRGVILYKGVQDESTVSNYLISSKINICLRYSIGIKEEYFFPSKFINICAAPGMVICNHFKNIPIELLKHCEVVEDEIRPIIMKVLRLPRNTLKWHHKQRIRYIRSSENWSSVAKVILQLPGPSNDRY
jgi:hypothetical protein